MSVIASRIAVAPFAILKPVPGTVEVSDPTKVELAIKVDKVPEILAKFDKRELAVASHVSVVMVRRLRTTPLSVTLNPVVKLAVGLILQFRNNDPHNGATDAF